MKNNLNNPTGEPAPMQPNFVKFSINHCREMMLALESDANARFVPKETLSMKLRMYNALKEIFEQEKGKKYLYLRQKQHEETEAMEKWCANKCQGEAPSGIFTDISLNCILAYKEEFGN